MSAARWERLAADLAKAGLAVRISARSYPGGTRRGITIRHDGGSIDIRDTWWHDNWTGWQVALEGRDGIAVHVSPRTKKRSEVVAAVLAASTESGRAK